MEYLVKHESFPVFFDLTEERSSIPVSERLVLQPSFTIPKFSFRPRFPLSIGDIISFEMNDNGARSGEAIVVKRNFVVKEYDSVSWLLEAE